MSGVKQDLHGWVSDDKPVTTQKNRAFENLLDQMLHVDHQACIIAEITSPGAKVFKYAIEQGRTQA